MHLTWRFQISLPVIISSHTDFTYFLSVLLTWGVLPTALTMSYPAARWAVGSSENSEKPSGEWRGSCYSYPEERDPSEVCQSDHPFRQDHHTQTCYLQAVKDVLRARYMFWMSATTSKCCCNPRRLSGYETDRCNITKLCFFELWPRRSQVCGHNVAMACHLCHREGIDWRVIETANQEMKTEVLSNLPEEVISLPVDHSEVWSTGRNYNSSRYASIACTLESDLNSKFSAESEQLQKVALQLLANLSNQGGHCAEALWSALYADNLAPLVGRAIGITWFNSTSSCDAWRQAKRSFSQFVCYQWSGYCLQDDWHLFG